MMKSRKAKVITQVPVYKASRPATAAERETFFPDRLLAALVLTAVVLLPLTFLPVMEDAFALPKVTLLRALAGAGLTTVALGFLSSERGRAGLPRAAGWLLLAYVSLNALAFAFSTDPGRSVFGERVQYQGFTTVLIYAGTFYVAARAFRSRVNVRLLFWSIALSGLAVSVYAVAQMVDLDPIEWAYGSGPPDRAFSSIGQANALAAYLVMVIPVSLGLVSEAERRVRWLPIVIVILALTALVLTFSRSGYLALAIALAFSAVPLVRRAGWRTSVSGALAICVAAAIAIALVPAAGDAAARAVSIVDVDDPSIQKRIGMWQVAGEITLDRPLLGTGQETYPEMFSEYRGDSLPGFGAAPARPESPHNHYLAIASSAGVPALVAYAGVIGAVFYCLYRGCTAGSPRRTALLLAIAGGATAHLLTDAFMTAETTSSWLFWVLMGTGIGLATGESPEGRPATAASTLSEGPRPRWRRPVAAGAIVVAWAAVTLAAVLALIAAADHSDDARLQALGQQPPAERY